MGLQWVYNGFEGNTIGFDGILFWFSWKICVRRVSVMDQNGNVLGFNGTFMCLQGGNHGLLEGRVPSFR